RLGGPAVHMLRVSWVYPDGEELFDQPNLARPKLATEIGDLTDPPRFWVVRIPPGYLQLDRANDTTHSGLVGAIRFQLHPAAAQFRLGNWLVPLVRSSNGTAFLQQLRAAEVSFFWYCRQADYHLALATTMATGQGPAIRGLQSQLVQLRKDNLKLLAEST